MDWRAISRSRSRLSAVAMDWRASSRSRSRPPPHPGQPFDQHTLSNSWSEGRFNFAYDEHLGEDPVGEMTDFGVARSFDASFIAPLSPGSAPTLGGRSIPGGGRSGAEAGTRAIGDEHAPATSPSIPIPGLATQRRYGSPPISSSLTAHSAHIAEFQEEFGADLGMLSSVQFSGSNPGMLSLGAGRNVLGPAFHPTSLPVLGMQATSVPAGALSAARQREYHLAQQIHLRQQLSQPHMQAGPTIQQAHPGLRFRKTSFDHTVARDAATLAGNLRQNPMSGLSLGMSGGGAQRHARNGSDDLSTAGDIDPILVSYSGYTILSVVTVISFVVLILLG